MPDVPRSTATPAEIRHTINNLLNGISTQAELAKLHISQGSLDEAARVLDGVVSDCKRCSRMHRKLLPD